MSNLEERVAELERRIVRQRRINADLAAQAQQLLYAADNGSVYAFQNLFGDEDGGSQGVFQPPGTPLPVLTVVYRGWAGGSTYLDVSGRQRLNASNIFSSGGVTRWRVDQLGGRPQVTNAAPAFALRNQSSYTPTSNAIFFGEGVAYFQFDSNTGVWSFNWSMSGAWVGDAINRSSFAVEASYDVTGLPSGNGVSTGNVVPASRVLTRFDRVGGVDQPPVYPDIDTYEWFYFNGVGGGGGFLGGAALSAFSPFLCLYYATLEFA